MRATVQIVLRLTPKGERLISITKSSTGFEGMVMIFAERREKIAFLKNFWTPWKKGLMV
jgi:hypothetical protein